MLLARDWVLGPARTSRGGSASTWVNTNSMALYLFHTTGMAIAIAVLFLVFDYLPPAEPTMEWWVSRPLWLVAPAVATYPFLLLYGRVTSRSKEPVGADELAT